MTVRPQPCTTSVLRSILKLRGQSGAVVFELGQMCSGGNCCPCKRQFCILNRKEDRGRGNVKWWLFLKLLKLYCNLRGHKISHETVVFIFVVIPGNFQIQKTLTIQTKNTACYSFPNHLCLYSSIKKKVSIISSY